MQEKSEDKKPLGADIPSGEDRTTLKFWKDFIRTSKKDKFRKAHLDSSVEAFEEYDSVRSEDINGNLVDGLDNFKKGTYPIYWASSQILEPAFYSRTPRIVASRKFDIDDDVALTASTIAERLGDYGIQCSDFDDVMNAVVSDFIHANKSTCQIVYDTDFDEQEVEVPLVPATNPETGEQLPDVFLDPQGDLYEDEIFQSQTDAGFIGKTIEKVPINQKVYLTSLNFDDVLHTPDAKNEKEILEKGYYFKLGKDEAIERFGAEALKGANWKTKGEKDDKKEHNEGGIGLYIDGWECWSRPDKTVYWVSECVVDKFLDTKPDPYGLTEFFPSPDFIITSKPRKHLYPTPAFERLKPTINMLHELNNRIRDLIGAIRRRCLVDGGSPDLIAALNDLESGEYVAVSNIQQIVEKGGIENMLFWIPVQELVQSISELQVLDDKFKNDFYEWFGVPDILRGASDPMETKGAQEIKSQSASDRFKYSKKLVHRIASDSIRLMVDLMIGVFTDEKIAKVVGYEFMTETEKQNFPAALQFLKSDEERMIRLEIESDSMNFVDDQLRSQQMNTAIQTVTAGMKEISQTAQIDPDFAKISVMAVLQSLETMMPAGREFSDNLKQASTKMFEKLDNPPPPPPPPPDYEVMKLDLKKYEAELKGYKAELDNENKKKELAQKDFKLMLDAEKQTADQRVEEVKLILEQSLQSFMMQMEAHTAKMEEAYLSIDQFKAKIMAAETATEELRLARQADVELITKMADAQKEASAKIINDGLIPQPTIEVNPTPVSVNIQMPKAKKKRTVPVYDELGNIIEIQNIEEEEPGEPIVLPFNGGE